MDETLRSAAGPTFTLLRLVTGASRKVQTAWQSVEGLLCSHSLGPQRNPAPSAVGVRSLGNTCRQGDAADDR
jgi:hypothetical protein